MAEFAYNNAKNTSIGHTLFELNCGYYPRMSYKEEVEFSSKAKLAAELSAELRELMIVCRENIYHTQKLQKTAHDKGLKPRSYAFGNKIWLNSKYIKIKQNQKFETKFFRSFWVLYPVGKQAYKLELFRKWRIHNVFHVLLLKQNITRKGWVDKEVRQMEFNAGDNDGGEYKVEAIWEGTVYARASKSGHLPGLYYLVLLKGYPKEENTWESA